MTENIHTPGPWFPGRRIFVPVTVGFPINSSDQGDTHHNLVGICPYWQNRDFGPTVKEAEANARMIAAAPDLVMAAKSGIESLERELALITASHCKIGPDGKPLRDTCDDEVRNLVEEIETNLAQARAAIFKATGES